MGRFVLFCLLILLAVSCKKNHFKKHEIAGHFYYDENREPMKDVPLVLIISDGSCEFGCNTYAEIAEATTDENGYFKFKYSQDNRDGTLQIAYDDSKTPGNASGGTIATRLPKNEDIFMDFFVIAKAYYKFKFNVKNQNLYGDSLFVISKGLDKKASFEICPNDSVDNCYESNAWFKKINSQVLFSESFGLKFNQDFEYKNAGESLWWGIGKKETIEILGEYWNNRDHQQNYKPTNYPDTTIVEIEIW